MSDSKDKILVLENDPNIPDALAHYIDEQDGDIQIITNLKNEEEKEIINAIDENDIIIIQSTFTNTEQIKKIIGLFSLFSDKEYRLIDTSGRLHYTIHELGKLFHNPFKFLFEYNHFKEIVFDKKIDGEKSGEIFQSFKYYFDEISLYYNKKHDAFFPERPICFYENELKPVYKYKPKWIMRNWVFKNDD